MSECAECSFSFPDELVQHMFLNGCYRPVCGVCALAITRKIHQMPTYQFRDGSMARELYLRAKAHKEKLAKSS